MPGDDTVSAHRDVLARLITMASPLRDSINTAMQLPWGRADELVTLTTADARYAIEQLTRRELCRQQLEDWAEAVHSRDEVALGPSAREMLADFLFEASTPELVGESDQEWAKRWFDRLPDS